MSVEVRTYRVVVTGFDFDRVFVRARSLPRARTICAQAIQDAGYTKTVYDAYTLVEGVQLHPEEDDRPLVRPSLGPEGLCVTDEAAAGHRSRKAEGAS